MLYSSVRGGGVAFTRGGIGPMKSVWQLRKRGRGVCTGVHFSGWELMGCAPSSKNTYNERFASAQDYASAVADENRAPPLPPNFERKLALATSCFPEVISKVRHIAALLRIKREGY